MPKSRRFNRTVEKYRGRIGPELPVAPYARSSAESLPLSSPRIGRYPSEADRRRAQSRHGFRRADLGDGA